jgi:outer membrane lipoprotein LolB
MRYNLLGGVVLALLALVGCESVPPAREVPDPAAAWSARQVALAELARWTAVGRIGVRSQDDAWSASIRWEQDGERFRLHLSGPLGQGLVRVSGEPGRVELRTAAREVHTAVDADDLLWAHTGFRVPVSILRHWVIGRTDPGHPVDALVLDPAGRPQAMRQAGWLLEIEQYAGPETLALPTKLTVSNAQVQARLVVSEWQLDP